jgi:hypothetical protein
VLNRIRRALALTRVRTVSRGRHRRPLASARPESPAAASPVPIGYPPLTLSQAPLGAVGGSLLPGEDVALVRPYVLAWERHTRARTVIVTPNMPKHAWPPAVMGVR